MNILGWLSSSPSLNSIENAWALTKRQFHNEPQTILLGLKDEIEDTGS